VIGANVFVAQATDAAGNVRTFTRTITRGQLLPPVITATVVGGATTRDPAVTGTVRAEHTLTSFRAALDRQGLTLFVNVFTDVTAGAFSFSAERLAQINGAPLTAGPHTLYLVAGDSDGLTSAVTAVAFTLDLSAQGSVADTVTANAGQYDYRY